MRLDFKPRSIPYSHIFHVILNIAFPTYAHLNLSKARDKRLIFENHNES